MARPRGIGNKNAVKAVVDSFSPSGSLRSVKTTGDFTFSVVKQQTTLVRLSALNDGGGRITVGVGGSGIIIGDVSGILSPPTDRRLTPNTRPSGVRQPDGSGFIFQEPGLYEAHGHIAASGSVGAIIQSELLLDGNPVANSRCATFAQPDLSPHAGAAIVPVNGLVDVAVSGQTFNIRVFSATSDITAIGSEDLDGAPHLNVTLHKLSSDSLTLNF